MTAFDRRDLLKTAAAVAAAATAGSAVSAFAADKAAAPSAAGSIYYSKEQPGQWKGKEGTHAPEVKVEGGKVSVVTPHPMSAEHFIVRHTVILADGTVLGAKNFAPADKPESSYDLPKDYKGKICATSFCNLHDLWVSEAEA
ncbi:desulfoferrodoxin family protein [Candidatus Electronema sp. TJ]|uniref:desulfoferrodoxin family protein n=1 Tax=Candidatus Electronema sp. TJ TaxID=3401573 RepID=UPI003AA90039